MRLKALHGITQWLGLYTITITLFGIESGSITKGLIWGLLSVTIKVCYIHAHDWLHSQVKSVVEEIDAAEVMEPRVLGSDVY